MRFVLFDEILEQHTVRSLSRALAARGHEVTATGPIWRGHLLPETRTEIMPISRHVSQIRKLRPDVLFNFRPSSLLPEMVNELKTAGIHTIAWLADDPVLYQVCYRHVVEAYNTPLHCGGVNVLSFYQKKHGRAGFNFPFWTDDSEFRYSYNPARAEFDLVFLGNCDGKVRAKRYELLSSLPFSVRIYGKVKNDRYHLGAGYLETTKQVSDALGKARCAVSIPQDFADYEGTAYDFPELADLGHFELPSRVIQYAALGLPVVSLEDNEPPRIFPELITCSNREELIAKAEGLLKDEARLRNLSAAVHARFRRSFSAEARAAFLESIVESPQNYMKLDIPERALCFASVMGEQSGRAAPTEKALNRPDRASAGAGFESLPTVETQRTNLRFTSFESPRKWRILEFGTEINGDTDVVACLRRALINLGHTVLHIDVRRHKDILLNPPERVSGFGPVVIDLRRVTSMVDRFRPQVIICMGGGLCFSPEDSRELKSRGILLLGITLSDPDVLETVIGHVGTFDFHTTNSTVALEKYREAGLGNTILFPFGIDSSYITTEVPPAPELGADVICLGHALNRPERQRMMESLAREFKVRTYGLGWHLPGAEPVTGKRVIQASREGRIHINFANTLAQYTNVKVGVFESIGNGAVVCTQKFPEMEEFFSYGKEIVGFGSEDELHARIRELLTDERRYESIRRSAFHRLISEHLYEHRWQALFTKVEQDISEQHAIVSLDRAHVLRKTLETHNERPRRIVISGFYGAGNTGDELILRSITDGVARERDDIQFIVASEEPASVGRLHACPAFYRGDLTAMDAEMSAATAAVLGGGGLWHDYSFERSGGSLSLFSDTAASMGGWGKLLLLAKIYDRPAHVFGVGVGPVRNPQARQLLRLLCEAAQTVVVRDQESKDLLEGIKGWRLTAGCVPDLVYSLDLGNLQVPSNTVEISDKCPIIAVNLRPWLPGNESLEYRVARALEVVARSHDCALVGIPMRAKDDEETLKRVFAMIRIPRPSLVLDWTGNFEELFGTIQASRALLAMRLHACLLGHRLGIPTLGISYDPKVQQHFKELGIAGRALPYDATVDDLAAGLTQVLALEGKLEPDVRKRVASLEEAARDGIRSLASLLGEAPPVRGAPSIRATGPKTAAELRIEQDYLHVKRQLELLNSSQDKVRSQLASVRTSFSYRLGNVLIQAVSNPGRNTLVLPYRLIRLCGMGLRSWRKTPAGTHAETGGS
jgi:polysaccharide pyruvyl transferase CsaB